MTERLRAGLMLSALVIFILITSSLAGSGDFIEFYIAARRLASGLNPYNAAFYPKGYGFGFPYPPLAIDLAIPVSHLLFPVAVCIWDVLCLLAYFATAYWWIEMLWENLPSFPEFSRIVVALSIPPCLLTFWFHNVNFFILFFGTAAGRLIWKGKSSFWAGLLAGGLLIKPHLTLIPLLELFRQSRNRIAFLSGVLLITFLSMIPFMNTLQPPGVLSRMVRSAQDYGRRSYYTDEQSIAFLLHKISGGLHPPSPIVEPSEMAGQPVKAGTTEGLLKVKALGLMTALLLWVYLAVTRSLPLLGGGLGRGFHHSTDAAVAPSPGLRPPSPETGRNTILIARPVPRRCGKGEGNGPDGLILAFTLNLLGAFYSHTYDSLFLMPLMASCLYSLSRRIHLSYLACFSFLSTLVVLEWTLTGGVNGVLNWNRACWISVAYASLGLLILQVA